jgi:thiamine-monophosphate kinase
MDEKDFVEYLKSNFSFHFGKGIGDDTSVVKTGASYQLITKDILIENIHFSLDYFNLEEIALRALAVNLSDIAAMGGEAEYFYLGLGLPQKFAERKIFDFFSGLKKGCEKWQVELAGGDYSASPTMFISITMVGKAENPIYRNGAQENDLIGITGATGESAVGLKLLQKGIDSLFAEKHKSVIPENKKGPALAKSVNSMIDVSDGLLIDLSRILAASKKGAKLFYEKIPVSENIKQMCAEHGIDEQEAVLAGGEDFVLLFTLSPGKEPALRKSVEPNEYYIIGEVTGEENKIAVTHNGKSISPKSFGYDHLKKAY